MDFGSMPVTSNTKKAHWTVAMTQVVHAEAAICSAYHSAKVKWCPSPHSILVTLITQC